MSIFSRFSKIKEKDKEFLQNLIDHKEIYDHCYNCDGDFCMSCSKREKKKNLLEPYKNSPILEIAEEILKINANIHTRDFYKNFVAERIEKFNKEHESSGLKFNESQNQSN